MFQRYRAALTGGNGEKVVHEVEATPVLEPQTPQGAEQATVVMHNEGDEKRASFWGTLVSSDPQALVAKETAIFASRALLVQTIGYKGHRAEIDFASDPVTVEDLFATLEKLCCANGWQLRKSRQAFFRLSSRKDEPHDPRIGRKLRYRGRRRSLGAGGLHYQRLGRRGVRLLPVRYTREAVPRDLEDH